MANPEFADARGVLRIQFPGDSAHDRQRWLVQRKLADQVLHRARDTLHQRRMERVRDVERRRLDPAGRERLLGKRDTGAAAGEHRLLRMVQVRRHHGLRATGAVLRRQGRKHLGDSGCVGGGAQHRSPIFERQRHHREPAARHQPHALFG